MPTMIMTDSRADLTMRIQTVKIKMKMIMNPIMMIVTVRIQTAWKMDQLKIHQVEL